MSWETVQVLKVSYFCVQSQDSMEHLSPEERACLMFFEETIEALEVQEDSGLSNDEPDYVFPAGPEVNGMNFAFYFTSNSIFILAHFFIDGNTNHTGSAFLSQVFPV